MKVFYLRKELRRRGLQDSGDKAELVARLQAAISQDKHSDIILDSNEIDSDSVLKAKDDKSQANVLNDTAVDTISQDKHSDIILDSNEIDSDSVLKVEDDKNQANVLNDTEVDTLNQNLALSGQVSPDKPTTESKPLRTLKRRITLVETSKDKSEHTKATDNKKVASEKIVLNRAKSIPPRTLKRRITPVEPSKDKSEHTKATDNKKVVSKKIVLNRAKSITSAPSVNTEKKEENIVLTNTNLSSNNVIKITADIDQKTRLELRAKRFGLPVKISDDERKEARKQRFGQTVSQKSSTISAIPTATLSENMEKLKKRAERFGQSVSKIMTDIEKKKKPENPKQNLVGLFRSTISENKLFCSFN